MKKGGKRSRTEMENAIEVTPDGVEEAMGSLPPEEGSSNGNNNAMATRLRYAELLQRAIPNLSPAQIADVLLSFANAHDIAMQQEKRLIAWKKLCAKAACCDEAFAELENDIAGKKTEEQQQ